MLAASSNLTGTIELPACSGGLSGCRFAAADDDADLGALFARLSGAATVSPRSRLVTHSPSAPGMHIEAELEQLLAELTVEAQRLQATLDPL